MIHQQQELEQSYEDLLIREQQVQQKLERMYEEQNKARMELKVKIDVSKAILSSLQRKTTDGFLYEPVPGETASKDKSKVVPIDFTGLLAKLRKQIIQIHVKQIGHGDFESKSTLQLLNVS